VYDPCARIRTGAVTGAWFGLLIGLIGALWGAVFGYLAHRMGSGRHD
jgi:hypothetical protein